MCFLFRGNLEFITFRQSWHYVWLRKGAVRPFVLMRYAVLRSVSNELHDYLFSLFNADINIVLQYGGRTV